MSEILWCFCVAAAQDSRNRVDDTLKAELPLLVSSANQESSTSGGDVSLDETVTEAHQMKWSAKFDEFKKQLQDQEKDLVRYYIIHWLQVKMVLEAQGSVFFNVFEKFAGNRVKPSEGYAVTMQRRSAPDEGGKVSKIKDQTTVP